MSRMRILLCVDLLVECYCCYGDILVYRKCMVVCMLCLADWSGGSDDVVLC